MNCTKLPLLFLVYQTTRVTALIYEDPVLGQFTWKYDIFKNDSKSWMPYVSKVVVESIKNSHLRKYYVDTSFAVFENLLIMRQIWRLSYFLFDPRVHDALFLMPAGQLHLQYWRYGGWPIPPGFKRYTWSFNLYYKFSVKIIVFYLNLRKVHQRCIRGNFSIKTSTFMDNEIYTFCGKHSFFVHYTPSSVTNLTLILKNDMMFEISLKYSVMTKGTLFNIKTKGNISHDIRYVHTINLLKITLYTFHLKVKKFRKVCLEVSDDALENYRVIDDPSVRVSAIFLTKRKFCGSSFQVILQVYKKNEPFTNENYLRYYGHDVLLIHQNIARHEEKMFAIPGPLCPEVNGSSFCPFRFEADPGYHINFTLLRVTFKGFTTTDCRYGGMSIYEQEEHILDICEEYGTKWRHYRSREFSYSRPSRSIYSSSYSLIVAVYIFASSGAMLAEVELSSTSCQPVYINICELTYFCGRFTEHPNFCLNWLSKQFFTSYFHITINRKLYYVSLHSQRCITVMLASDWLNLNFTQEVTATSDIECSFLFYFRHVLNPNAAIVIKRKNFFEYFEYPHRRLPKSFNVHEISQTIIQNRKLANYRYGISHNTDRILCTSSLLYNVLNVGHTYLETTRIGIFNYEILMSYETSGETSVASDDLLHCFNSNFRTVQFRGIGGIKHGLKSLFNYDVLALRMTNVSQCPQERNFEQDFVLYVDGTNYLKTRFIERQIILNWPIEGSVSCFNPTFLLSLSGTITYFQLEQFHGFREPTNQYHHSMPVNERVWPKESHVEVFWLKGSDSINCSIDCCIPSHCESLVQNNSKRILLNGINEVEELTFNVRQTVFTLILKNYKLFNDEKALEDLPTPRRGKYTLPIDWVFYNSWNSVSSICKNLGGFLPVFNSRKEIEEFVFLLKTGRLPLVEAIFIGLYAESKLKVSNRK